MVHDKKLSAVDLNLLVVLRALLTERHVTRAAAQVGLSQSAASHALGRLRALYGDPLLVRSGRRLELTSRALSLLPRLERGLDELSSSISGEPPFDPALARLSFTVGMADYVQAVVLAPLLRLLSKEAPFVELLVVTFPDTHERMEAGTMDLGLLGGSEPPSRFSSKRLFSDGFVCVVRRNHPRVRGARVSLERYLELGHVLVAPTGEPGSIVDTELSRRGLRRRIVLRVSSFLVVPIVVEESDLISTGPERLLRPMAERYPLRVLPNPLRLGRFGLSLVWHPRRDHDPAHSWLRGLVSRASREI